MATSGGSLPSQSGRINSAAIAHLIAAISVAVSRRISIMINLRNGTDANPIGSGGSGTDRPACANCSSSYLPNPSEPRPVPIKSGSASCCLVKRTPTNLLIPCSSIVTP
jgi:hypothetical protein